MELTDGPVLLRKLVPGDASKMAALANNAKIAVNLRDGFPHPYTLSDAGAFLEKYANLEPLTIFAIEFMGTYAGNISLMPGVDVYRKSAEIGYFLGEPFWNKGIMTRAVNLITGYGFRELGLVRIHTGVFEYNTASMRVLEKCGFIREGDFRKSVFKQGKLWDEVRYAKVMR